MLNIPKFVCQASLKRMIATKDFFELGYAANCARGEYQGISPSEINLSSGFSFIGAVLSRLFPFLCSGCFCLLAAAFAVKICSLHSRHKLESIVKKFGLYNALKT